MKTMLFTINDATYAYDRVGSGPPVVLLHGFTGRRQTWQSLVNVLKETYQVVTVDLPGHGQTETRSPRTMEACCSDLKQLFKHLGFEKVHLLGYSLGGRTALSFAVAYPNMVASLILESASPGLADKSEQMKRQAHDQQLAERLEADGLVAFVDFWGKIPLFATQTKLAKPIRQQVRQERLSQSPTKLAQSLRSMGTGAQPAWWDYLKSLKMPILLIVGTQDTKFVTINKDMLKQMQTAHLQEVENCGHAIHVEQPNKFGKIVKRFLNNLLHSNHMEEKKHDNSMGTSKRI